MTKLSNTEGKAPLFCCGQQSQTWVMLPKSPCCSHTSSGRLWGLTGPVWLQGYWNYHRVTGVWSSRMSSHVSFLGGCRLLGTHNKEKVSGSGLCSAQPTNMLSPVGDVDCGSYHKVTTTYLSFCFSQRRCLTNFPELKWNQSHAIITDHKLWTGQQRSR